MSFDVPLGRAWLEEHGCADGEVSGRHIELTRVGAGVRLRDVGSRNGTWLDGRPLPADHGVDLREGAVIRLGSTLLVFRAEHVGPLSPDAPLGELIAPFGMRGVGSTLERMSAQPPATVLIVGETGTGKELMARAVAARCGRAGNYGAVNIAGVASGVFESQLFGHVAGAFSDARGHARGVLAAHAGGTVFLDEIGELPLGLQPKLLRVIDNREVLPVGAERAVVVDVLLIGATNRDLEGMVARGEFRRDLLARLEGTTLTLPPLRERAEDVYAIACGAGAAMGMALDASHCEVEAVERLLLCGWTSNVRGLVTCLRRVRDVDPEPGLHLWSVQQVLGQSEPVSSVGPHDATSVQQALDACGGNESHAARHLGISRGKLRRILGKA